MRRHLDHLKKRATTVQPLAEFTWDTAPETTPDTRNAKNVQECQSTMTQIIIQSNILWSQPSNKVTLIPSPHCVTNPGNQGVVKAFDPKFLANTVSPGFKLHDLECLS